MRWFLLVLSVIFGYIFSQTLNGLFVYHFYIRADKEPISALPFVTVLFFILVGVTTGAIIAFISRTLKLMAAYISAGLILLITIANIVLDVAAEPLLHKLIVIFVLTPSILVGVRLMNFDQLKAEPERD